MCAQKQECRVHRQEARSQELVCALCFIAVMASINEAGLGMMHRVIDTQAEDVSWSSLLSYNTELCLQYRSFSCLET